MYHLKPHENVFTTYWGLEMHEKNILNLAKEFTVNPAAAREIGQSWIVPVCDYCFHSREGNLINLTVYQQKVMETTVTFGAACF